MTEYIPIPDNPLDISLDPAPSDPIALFRAWYDFVKDHSSLPNPNAMSLATVSEDGRPSSRMVLMKHFDENGVIFYTNYNSRKARDLEHSHRAALLFHWDEFGLQVRIEGTAEKVSSEVSDAYFASRERESQAGAWASRQSEPCEHFSKLAIAYMKILEKYEGQDIPRPPFWGGYRVSLESMEFWVSQEHRIHHRFLYTQDLDGNWRSQRLYP